MTNNNRSPRSINDDDDGAKNSGGLAAQVSSCDDTNSSDGKTVLQINVPAEKHLLESGASSSTSTVNSFKKVSLPVQIWNSFCCIDRENDFVQVLRKACVGVNLLVAIAMVAFFGVYLVILDNYPTASLTGREPDDSMLGVRVLAIVWAILAAIPYMFLRARREVTTMTVDFLIGVHIFCSFLSVLLWPSGAVIGLMCVVGMVAILTQAQYVVLHLLFVAIVYLFDVQNQSYKNTSYEVVLPNAYEGLPIDNFCAQLVAEVLLGVTLAGVYAQSMDNIRHVSAERAGVEMCRKIMSLLRRYDTEGVHEALKEYGTLVNRDLYDSFKQMNKNLETYKRFLPNYLFYERDPYLSEMDEDEELEELSSSTTSVEDELDRIHSSANLAVDSLISSLTDGADNVSVSSRLSHNSGRSRASTLTTLSNRNVFFEGNIALARVEVPALQGHRDASSASTFVELIYTAAKMTKAAVHCLTGDSALVSWNATYRVVQPEMKAIRFLNHLKRYQMIRFGAVVFSGPACCYSVTTQKRQHATVISAGWLPMMNTAYNLACQYKSMVLDEQTESVSSKHYQSIFVDRVGLFDAGSSTASNSRSGSCCVSAAIPTGASSFAARNTSSMSLHKFDVAPQEGPYTAGSGGSLIDHPQQPEVMLFLPQHTKLGRNKKSSNAQQQQQQPAFSLSRATSLFELVGELDIEREMMALSQGGAAAAAAAAKPGAELRVSVSKLLDTVLEMKQYHRRGSTATTMSNGSGSFTQSATASTSTTVNAATTMTYTLQAAATQICRLISKMEESDGGGGAGRSAMHFSQLALFQRLDRHMTMLSLGKEK